TFSRFVFLSAVVNVLLNFALIPWLGILGAAIATALSMLFLAFCVVVRLYFLAMPGSRKV
ncbi:MAG: polysaccharide biosynthesis C-terminal domain-containing protein, partial [Amphritea sp.]|nr:polysaccharide biosynthesis C-terminal domain-containing protein [Amphritea sp.]